MASQADFAVIRAFNGSYGPDKNSVASYDALTSAGLQHVDYYIQVCRPFSPNQQIRDAITQINGTTWETLWIDILQSGDPDCPWPTDFMSNCIYLNALIGEALNWVNIWDFKFNVGVRTSQTAWKSIMGSASIFQ